MATGPEHYLEAERLLLDCQIMRATEREPATYPALEDGVNTIANALAAAQVHATLALAAATALGFETGGGPTWSFVANKPYSSRKDDDQ